MDRLIGVPGHGDLPDGEEEMILNYMSYLYSKRLGANCIKCTCDNSEKPCSPCSIIEGGFVDEQY